VTNPPSARRRRPAHRAPTRTALLALALVAAAPGDPRLDPAAAPGARGPRPQAPNICLVLADDWSWPHAGVLGDPQLQTPGFDRVATEGVLFTNAFSATPSCTSSRASLLCGQQAWRLAEAADLWGTFPAALTVYTDLLAAAGYHVGHLYKSWGPGVLAPGGRTTDPCGLHYGSLNEYLAARPPGAPLCLWVGPELPHRPYVQGSGLAAGFDPGLAVLPACLPDAPEVRSDLLDYYVEVEEFDQQVVAALDALELLGELDQTLFVVSSDNGLPFPRCKGNLYDTGTRVPLAVRWPPQVPGGRVVSDFTTLADLAPTFLEAAGLPVPAVMTAASLMPVLASTASGQVDPARDHVVLARERHTTAQACFPGGYPMRALRNADYLYVVNLEPARLPAGTSDPRRSYLGKTYADVDDSPTKDYMLANAGDPSVAPLHALAFGQRPREELYDLRADPDQLVDVAAQPAYAAVRAQLGQQLGAARLATADPRSSGAGQDFDRYPYYGPRQPPLLALDVAAWDQLEPGAVTLELEGGPALAGLPFEVLGSSGGTGPGLTFGAVTVPLSPGPYFYSTLNRPGSMFSGSPGVFDRQGSARVLLRQPPGPQGAALFSPGAHLWHALLVRDARGLPLLASCPCRLEIVPVTTSNGPGGAQPPKGP